MTLATTLSSTARDRLAKLCGLLGSDHAGERAAAGLKASELLRAHGLTWCDLFAERQAASTSRSAEPDPASFSGWRADLALCRTHVDLLSDRDADFVLSISARRSALSAKQLMWLNDIASRLRLTGQV